MNIEPGQWFGPQMISVVLRNLNDKFKPVPQFEIVTCIDGNIFLDKIWEKVHGGSSVFVLVPLRLGLDSIQDDYLF